MKAPSSALLTGRRALDGISELTIRRDLAWIDELKSWVLEVRLDVGQSNHAHVPAQTDWFAVIGDEYPGGKIEFYPANEGGLKTTFPHQMNNGRKSTLGWRLGHPCLDSREHILRTRGYDHEPMSGDTRLEWRARRAIMWLRDASTGTLTANGDPFELPHFPGGNSKSALVAYVENDASYLEWDKFKETYGYARFVQLNGEAGIQVVSEFRNAGGNTLIKPNFGLAVTGTARTGLWVKLPQIPVMPVWEAPTTWGQLAAVCSGMGIDLFDEISQLVPQLRQAFGLTMLIGFPIPKLIGGSDVQLRWQALKLPTLTKPKGRIRRAEAKYWEADRATVLRDDNRIDWQESEYWDAAEISTRGRLSQEITKAHVVILGAGALGCMVSELLIRGGVTNLTVIDPDNLSIGNLCRHSLGIGQLTLPKAIELANRLNQGSPHARVRGFTDAFPPKSLEGDESVKQCDLLIDCTGSDDVITLLSETAFSNPKLFVSLSVGVTAKRLFSFSAVGTQFPREKFFDSVDPWLERERKEFPEENFPREGTGCWHAVFPAGGVDISMMAAIAVKQLAITATSLKIGSQFYVFEQQSTGDSFSGVQRVERES